MTARSLSRVCVFAGSSPGVRPEYAAAAGDLGRELAGRGIGLVFGGGKVGLMGVMADAALEAGGEAVGVIPEALVRKELAHDRLTALEVTANMHERKARMAELADGFIALPGGTGTLEELAEVFTWGQLGFHEKPFALLDVEGYYDGLVGHLARAVSEGFLKPEHLAMLFVSRSPAEILDRFAEYRPRHLNKWIDAKDL